MRKLIASTVVAVALATVPLTQAHAATTLGGYVMAATAGPVTLILEAPTAGIPADPAGEMNLARTIAKTEVGSGYGLASIAWPGSTVANVPSVLSDQVNDNFDDNGAPEFFPQLPNYPVRAETFYPQGPERQSSGVETTQMRASSVEGASEAYSSGGDVVFNGLVDARRVVSFSRSVASGGTAISEATASLQDVSILGGLITAKLISNGARAVSDGTTATITGDFTIAGLQVGGPLAGLRDQDGEPIVLPTNGVSVDGDGLHVTGQDDTGPGRDEINEAGRALAEAGITLIAPEPIDTVNGAAASRAHDGLMIVIDARKFQPYLNMIPDVIRQELEERGVFADQTVIISIGGVATSANAAPAFVLPPPPVVPPVAPPPPAAPAPQIITLPGTTQTIAPPAAGSTPTFAARPVAAAVPLPFALAIFVALFGFLGMWGLGTFADRVTMPPSKTPDHH